MTIIKRKYMMVSDWTIHRVKIEKQKKINEKRTCEIKNKIVKCVWKKKIIMWDQTTK